MSWLSVAFGGALGAMARYAVALALAAHSTRFPLATLLANILGSLLMAVLYVVIVEKLLLPAAWRQFLMVGFLGAFTTFSTFSMDAVLLLQRGQGALALAYVAASVLACVVAAGAGYAATQALLRV